jgi:hypothetical protein
MRRIENIRKETLSKIFENYLKYGELFGIEAYKEDEPLICALAGIVGLVEGSLYCSLVAPFTHSVAYSLLPTMSLIRYFQAQHKAVAYSKQRS